ncbi:hypothetical protein LGT39_10805 [Demequina sp. TTPB684]|uniref:hypothetical protein n=1 Tax=unclassified Demequina TaxID=2620311 RepID=UPI001CF49D2C|nr:MULTISPECIES: hypothetical protein [unclassified Demequina]MCB2413333.1 hypothetical protein [Demequina sp. TTPB684]UPU87472.1 hypothetical protein LGT36_009375 [Demequina sp. TMPB413]
MNATALAAGILPSLGVGGLFFFVMRGIMRADRREREAIAQLDREEEEAAQRLTAEHGGQDAQ